MAFAHVGDIGTALSTANNQTSLVMTTSATLDVGNVGILIVATDNITSGADGDGGAVASVADSAGNEWKKAIQFENTQGATQAGANCAIYYTRAKVQLTSGGTITATFGSGTLVDASAMTAKEYTMAANKMLQLVATNQLADDGATQGSLNATTPNISCLRVRGVASESNSTTALTATGGGWALFTQAISGAGTSATEMGVRGEWLISTGTGSASAPTNGAGAVDHASAYAAFMEFDIPDVSPEKTVYKQPNFKSAAMFATGLSLVLMPPELLIPPPVNFVPEPPQFIARSPAITNNIAAIELNSQFRPFAAASWGWENQSPQPPFPSNRKRGAILEGDDGTQAVMVVTAVATPPFVERQTQILPTIRRRIAALDLVSQFRSFAAATWGWENQAWQPPHTHTEKSGAIQRGHPGIEAPFVFVPPPQTRWVADQQISLRRPRVNKGGIRSRSQFAIYPSFVPWQCYAQEWQPPTVRQLKRSAIFRGNDGNQAVYVFVPPPIVATAAFSQQSITLRYRLNRGPGIEQTSSFRPFTAVAWGWENQAYQPPHQKYERAGALARGDDGNQNTFTFAAVVNIRGWETVSLQPPHPRRERAGAIATGDPGHWDGLRRFFDYGWHVQHWQPPRRRAEVWAAIAPKNDGIDAPFIRFFNYGWAVQHWQPPHPRPERFAAIAPKEDGIEGIKPFGLQTADYRWFETPNVYPRRNVERWAAIAPKSDGIDGPFIRFFDYGWHVQHWQPPHPRPERWAAIAPHEDGIEGVKPQGLQTGDFKWFETPWVYTSPVRQRNDWAAIAPKDDGIYSPFLRFFNFGFENQAWQPPSPQKQRDNFAALVAGDSPLTVLRPPVITWFESQYVHYRRKIERAGALVGGDDGTQDRYRRFFAFGFENQSWQPPHRGTEHKAGAVMIGDQGHYDQLRRWYNFGWEVQAFQPPTRRYWLAGAIITPVFIENLFVHVPPPPVVPPRPPTAKGPLWTVQPGRQNVADAERHNVSDEERRGPNMPRRYKDRS